MRHSVAVALLMTTLVILFPTHSNANAPSQATLTLSRSSVTIIVGDKANLTVTFIAPASSPSSQACFSVGGFPSSGFVASFLPRCVGPQEGMAVSILTVEATPAAAPQSFTASVVANFGNQIVQANLTITVVPSMPPWMPWGLFLGFVAIFIITLLWAPKRRGKKTKKK